MVSIPACHAGDRGSIPRRGDFLCGYYDYLSTVVEMVVWITSDFLFIMFHVITGLKCFFGFVLQTRLSDCTNAPEVFRPAGISCLVWYILK